MKAIANRDVTAGMLDPNIGDKHNKWVLIEKGEQVKVVENGSKFTIEDERGWRYEMDKAWFDILGVDIIG